MDTSFSTRLPDNFHQRTQIDFGADKKVKTWLFVSAAITAFAAAGIYILAFSWNFGKFSSIGVGAIIGLIAGIISAAVLHEFIHWLCITLYGWKKASVKFKRRMLLPHPCVPDGYFSREAYYTISLLPLILIGLSLLITLFIVRYQVFFVIYVIFILQIIQSLADIYAAAVLGGLPLHTAVSENGSAVTYYVRKLTKKGNK